MTLVVHSGVSNQDIVFSLNEKILDAIRQNHQANVTRRISSAAIVGCAAGACAGGFLEMILGTIGAVAVVIASEILS